MGSGLTNIHWIIDCVIRVSMFVCVFFTCVCSCQYVCVVPYSSVWFMCCLLRYMALLVRMGVNFVLFVFTLLLLVCACSRGVSPSWFQCCHLVVHLGVRVVRESVDASQLRHESGHVQRVCFRCPVHVFNVCVSSCCVISSFCDLFFVSTERRR